MNARWIRVTKKRPCNFCGRGDWCTYSDEIGLALCMRVESDRPSKNSMGGWLHKTGDGFQRPYVPIRKAVKDRPINAEEIWRRWFERTGYGQVDAEGVLLGVDTDALRAIGCAWAEQYKAWAFPMRDAREKVIGIRLRNDEGHKWAVKGSHQGLFIPSEYPFDFQGVLYIVEGPTDLAAALTLGLYAIGRPTCIGQEHLLIEAVKRQRANRVVIVTDNDEPGLRGAAKLQSILPVLSCLWVPPAKDIREFLNRGGNSRMIQSAINDLVWTRPSKREAA